MVRGRRRAGAAVALAFAGVVAGCSLVPAFERPAVPVAEAWSTEPTAAAPLPVAADWWRRFADAELDRLVSEALAANPDLAAAIARIDQARAVARIAGAPLLPSVEAAGSASRIRTWSEGDTRESTTDEVRLTAAYELDLWGRNSAARQSATAALAASIHDKEALALVLQAEVASTFFEVLAFKERVAIARKNVEAAREVLRLIEIQLVLGAATALDLAQQRAATATFEAQVPFLEQQLLATETALAVLLGRAPGRTGVRAETLDDLALPAIAAGQPSDLLGRRPDIRRAEADLVAANADIGAARAAFYPSVTLTASAAASGLVTSGSSALLTLATGLVAPIFEGGRLEGELDRSKARQQELVAAYRRSVLTAFKEVEDALSGVETSALRSASLATAAREASESFRLAQLSYGAGASDFLTVLDAQRTLLESRDNLVVAELARYTATTDLFKALGGGWEGDIESGGGVPAKDPVATN